MKLKIISALILIAFSLYWPVESTPVDVDTDKVKDDGITSIEVFRQTTEIDTYYSNYCNN